MEKRLFIESKKLLIRAKLGLNWVSRDGFSGSHVPETRAGDIMFCALGSAQTIDALNSALNCAAPAPRADA